MKRASQQDTGSQRTCPNCHGKGRVKAKGGKEQTCGRCRGTGKATGPYQTK